LAELSGESSEQLIKRLAERLGQWGLSLPAILCLEVVRPLSFIASQGLLLCEPLLGFLSRTPQVAEYADLMADRANVDRLVAYLEQAHGEEKG
jgi:hypothetical protein